MKSFIIFEHAQLQIFMQEFSSTVKPVLSGHSKKDKKLVFKTNYSLMQVKGIAILSTFIKLPFVFKTFVCLFLSGR